MESEPVGNQPRQKPVTEDSMKAITGNTHKNREADAGKTADRGTDAREPVTKMIKGQAIVRKPPWYKKLGRSMIAEDAGSVGEHILMNVVIPGIKVLIVTMVGQSVEQVLMGSARNRVGRQPLGLSLRDQVNYSRISSDRDPRPMMSREARARHNFNEIVLPDRIEAISTVDFMVDRIARYGTVTVADLYDFVGTTGSYADRSWGWTDLRTADVRQVVGGFLLDLPSPEPIR